MNRVTLHAKMIRTSFTQNPKKAAKSRRFLIAEAIYMNTGDMCPLKKLVELRRKYKLRFILDENISFGTLGEHGRGLTEHLDVNVSSRMLCQRIFRCDFRLIL